MKSLMIVLLLTSCSTASYVEGCYDAQISAVQYENGYVKRSDRWAAKERCEYKYRARKWRD